MEKENALERLRKHAENMNSDWRERAEVRRANRNWIRKSQEIALIMINHMEEKHMTQSALAEKMGCSQQYISKLLKGKENLSLETIVKIEEALGIELLVTIHKYQYEMPEDINPTMVAEEAFKYGKIK